MDVGVLGSGDVAKALARGFVAEGHSVKMGSRDPNAAGLLELAEKSGGRLTLGSPTDAARHGKVVVLALLGSAVESVIGSVGANAFAGKVVIDPANPLEFDANRMPRLFVGFSDSLGERVQRALPEARVVKAFNTVGNPHMYKPKFAGGPPDMFYCGNDAEAKKTVKTILTAFGWNALDYGGIEGSRILEPLCLAWVMGCQALGTWDVAYKFLHA
jgi:8-hydroxy-5-deazaflavin:NADPH oxidoreductase